MLEPGTYQLDVYGFMSGREPGTLVVTRDGDRLRARFEVAPVPFELELSEGDGAVFVHRLAAGGYTLRPEEPLRVPAEAGEWAWSAASDDGALRLTCTGTCDIQSGPVGLDANAVLEGAVAAAVDLMLFYDPADLSRFGSQCHGRVDGSSWFLCVGRTGYMNVASLGR